MISGQIYLDSSGINLFRVEDSKTIIYTVLHKKDVKFHSLDGVLFVSIDISLNGSIELNDTKTATVVTTGPSTPSGQKIKGQGILLTTKKGEKNYFYLSPNGKPPLLKANDIFLSDSGVILTVTSANDFNLKTSASGKPFAFYFSSDGFNFEEKSDKLKTAKIVTHGPDGSSGEQVLGQAVKLINNTYFYYSRNADKSVSEGFSVKGTPIYINQYKTYPTARTPTQNYGFKPNQPELPFLSYNSSNQLFSI